MVTKSKTLCDLKNVYIYIWVNPVIDFSLDLQIYNPKTPDMQNLSKRFETFTNWPTTNTQTPKQVAEAGFYFTGKMMQIELNKVYSV